MSEALSFPEIVLTQAQFFGKALLFSNVDSCSEKTLESLPLRDGSPHAAHATNLSVRPHNFLCKVKCKMIIQHLRNGLFDERTIFLVYESQIFIDRWGLVARIKAIDLA